MQNIWKYLLWTIFFSVAVQYKMVWATSVATSKNKPEHLDLKSINNSTFKDRSLKSQQPLTRAHIFNETFLTIPGDFVEMGKYPLNHPWVTVGVVAATVGLITVDKSTTTFLQRNLDTHWSPNSLWYNPPGAAPEDGYLLLGLGGLYLGGNLFDSPANQIAALASIKSVAYSVVISQLVLKTVFGRIRPNPNLSNPSAPYNTALYTNNPWDFFRKNIVIVNTGSGCRRG